MRSVSTGAVALIALIAAAGPGLAQTDSGIDPSLCRTLVRHRPSPDAAYRPGVDVKGRPVAPADLPGSAGATASATPFDIPLTLGLARRMGLRVPTGGLPGDTVVGRLTLDGDRLSLNGQPIGGASEAQLYAYCRTR